MKLWKIICDAFRMRLWIRAASTQNFTMPGGTHLSNGAKDMLTVKPENKIHLVGSAVCHDILKKYVMSLTTHHFKLISITSFHHRLSHGFT